MVTETRMQQEALAVPQVIAAQLEANAGRCAALGAALRETPPQAIMMIGRGTSDHAGVFAKYLFEVEAGIPVFAAAPSVAGIYQRQLKLENCLAICISQSGQSPDIVQQAELAKAGGAKLIAIVNVTDSPLARLADTVLPLHAGPELAVAATKSYLASLSVLVQMCAYWQQSHQLHAALEQLPEQLQQAQNEPAMLHTEHLQQLRHCVVLGRGFGYAIAREVALKLKEVLGIHAEAFSSAEFLHGPVTLVEKHLTVFNIHIHDEGSTMHQRQLADIEQRGAEVIQMKAPANMHPRLQPLAVMQRFYLDIEHAARQLGLNPDAPPGLKKVTETH
ncbi:glucosamine-6-phosphate deaminase NagB-II [Pseudidiomarina insulisalsae]|uniref:Glutamine--fructose-6-phosphate aminotransferase n=1 Tax=Pseudidiomarina insulisalsae TaxID=575789 RepID=A0A432YPT0_9GAMM|nr:SIS domain-containing protein [Pseudidiomarina insulisalsae]RUO63085.1 glutamine--fructose-6-phosphate aminotransferase [Pseudidiomarina insulisalsae]